MKYYCVFSKYLLEAIAKLVHSWLWHNSGFSLLFILFTKCSYSWLFLFVLLYIIHLIKVYQLQLFTMILALGVFRAHRNYGPTVDCNMQYTKMQKCVFRNKMLYLYCLFIFKNLTLVGMEGFFCKKRGAFICRHKLGVFDEIRWRDRTLPLYCYCRTSWPLLWTSEQPW